MILSTEGYLKGIKTRNDYQFVVRRTKTVNNDCVLTYPHIVLYNKKEKRPVHYTEYEKYLQVSLTDYLIMEPVIQKAASHVCDFLNYLLYKTEIVAIHDCTYHIILHFFREEVLDDDNILYTDRRLALRNRDVFEFLARYYVYNYQKHKFNYTLMDLLP